MRFQKQLAGLCLLTLLATIVLTTQVQVQASPGLSLTKYKPTTHEIGALLVDDPTWAYDWSKYKDANVNGDTVIDISDLSQVALKWNYGTYL